MSLSELHCADEVFTTGTMGEVSFRHSSSGICLSAAPAEGQNTNPSFDATHVVRAGVTFI